MATTEVSLNEVRIDDEITVWYDDGSCGQGGKVVSFNPLTIRTPYNGCMEYDKYFAITVDRPLPAEDCINYSDDCLGPVEYHSIDSFKAFPRCRAHLAKRLTQRENSIELYANSDVAPSWFDPANAGESWGDDY